MNKGTIDRRVARSRAMLQGALLALLARKDYAAITVASICAEAKVGRATFYAHYKSKDDLLRAKLKDTRRQLLLERRHAAARQPRRDAFGFSAIMLDHARHHMHLHAGLFGNRGGDIASAAIRRTIDALVQDELGEQPGPSGGRDAPPREFAVRYVAGAYRAVLDWWLDRGIAATPEQIDAWFQRLTATGLGAWLGAHALPSTADAGKDRSAPAVHAPKRARLYSRRSGI